MKERPILFSAPMVRAILAGTETQTRRVLKQATGPSLSVGMDDDAPGVAELSWLWGDGPGHEVEETIKRVACPYGQPGDRLWVRESFWAFGRWETRFDPKKGRDAQTFIDMTAECGKAYQFTDQMPEREKATLSTVIPSWWRRPSIHMPRAASRITLEVTGVRAERLQDISETDALAEGARTWASEQGTPVRDLDEARLQFRALWTDINGGESWDANPWVWVVEFKKRED